MHRFISRIPIVNKRRNLRQGGVALGAIIFTAAALLVYTQFDIQLAAQIVETAENTNAQTLLSARQASLHDARSELQTKAARIIELESQNTSLNQQLETLKQENTQLKARSFAKPVVANTIYDRIRTTNEAEKALIVRALDLLKAYDPANYKIANDHVSDIYVIPDCYAYQIKRTINTGTCNMEWSDIIMATVIVHEARHVYNVYVNKIYSSGTKEQELPSYQAQLQTAQILGAPAWWITSIENSIAYYSSLPV